MGNENRKNSRAFRLTIKLVLLLLLSGCTSVTRQPFDPEIWKESGVRLRGGMIEDIRERRIFAGMTKVQVHNLLGNPDYIQPDWISYKVHTISRCYIWECRVETTFDPQTGTALNRNDVSD